MSKIGAVKAASTAHNSDGKSSLAGTPARVAVLVLGMHRSGTSALARVLSLLGCALPRNLLGPNPTQEAGHWESEAIRDFNDEVLKAIGSEWSDWLPVHEGWYRSPLYADHVARGRAVLREEFGAAPMMVLKDPRMCRMMPFWNAILEEEGIRPAIVMPVRNPLEVADSLKKRDGMDVAVGLLLWLRHVLEAERATRAQVRVTCSYGALLENWAGVAARIGSELGLAWSRGSVAVECEVEQFLKPDLRHNVHRPEAVMGNPMLSGWVRQTYEILLRWDERGEDAADHAALDRIRAAFDEAGPAFARPLLAGRMDQQRADALARQLAQDRHYLEGRIAELQYDLAQASQKGAMEQESAALRAELERVRAHESEAVAQLQQAQGEVARARAEAEAAQGALTALQEWAMELEAGAQGEASEGERAAAQADIARMQGELAEAQAAVVAAEAQARSMAEHAHQKVLEVRAEAEQRLRAAEQQALAAKGACDAAGQALLASEEALLASERGRMEVERALREAEQARVASEQALLDTAQMGLEARQRAESEAERARASELALEAMVQDLAGAAQRVAELESALIQRQEENAQVWSELGEVRRELGAMFDALHAARNEAAEAKAKLEDSKGWVFRLAGERQAGDVALRRAEYRLAQSDKARKEAERRLERLSEELARAREAAARQPVVVERDPAPDLAQWQAMAQDMADLRRQLREEKAARSAEAAQVGRMQEEAAMLTGLLGEAQAQAAGAEERAQAAQAQAAGAENARADLEQKLAERYAEMVAMTTALKGHEADARQSIAQAEWLREVSVVLLEQPTPLAKMLAGLVDKRKMRLLKKRGLFDTAAYLERYPDVAASGIEPLNHFILHGLAEGRRGQA